MIRYGFELEGFYSDEANLITIPPNDYPTDGFPGLVELRTTGGKPLNEAYAEIVQRNLDTPNCLFAISRFMFSREDRALIRRRHNEKSAWDIQNLYGKAPRLLGNNTIASFQISVSNMTRDSFRDKEGKLQPAFYGPIDVPRIVRALDEEFAVEIAEARRQPGEYCIKDNRLEYRSLPNSVFSFEPHKARRLLKRIKAAVEGE